jgi:hypothetical protein
MTSIASGLLSISTYRRPSAAATAPSVPDPAKKSRHQSPGLVLADTIRRTMPSGFWVG